MGRVTFEVVNVTKEIKGQSILKSISFNCVENTATAILGHNGSGKSTLLKILAGIYEPTSGSVVRNTRKIAYVPEHFPENLRFKLKEYLQLMASFQGFTKEDVEIQLSQYFRTFGIEQFVNTPLKQCSKGTKQKVGLIQALLSKPEVLLLDEPLTGLDTASQHELINLLEKLKRQATIIFTTHEYIMIEALADQVLELESGEVTFQNEPIKVERLIKTTFKDQEIFSGLDLVSIEYESNSALITVEAPKSDELLMYLLKNNCSILEIKEKR
ncbi:ABC transporter ATP-binding protein [Neobacillus sp. WH10]|uniref:ABC transporter ATP-binding protein n=1 Tax=Neobacillus sp. WH10 TaxID=3047873 RepID=UPI0024C127FF|nr:ABC transporter ATP-binding protein [Neobacillus sp. WH10]WHY79017.1 ABC transporter ATP-binding protein [Neobacillus sp. WH10]